MPQELIIALKRCTAQIEELEAQARQCLEDGYNIEAYHKTMCQKARLLYELIDHVQAFTKGLDRKSRQYVQDRLGGFSHGAGKALSLDSVFYMAALLYPEDYKDGDKNDLQIFIDCLERGDF